MPKKKKVIMHIQYHQFKNSLCGFDFASGVMITTPKRDLKKVTLNEDERFCHKCKHSHKLNLAKVKK
jgi:hypothetical protein